MEPHQPARRAEFVLLRIRPSTEANRSLSDRPQPSSWTADPFLQPARKPPLTQIWHPATELMGIPFLLISMTSKERRPRATSAASKSAEINGLICGGLSCPHPHHIWLCPPEHRSKEKNNKAATDLAGKIPRLPPGMTPSTGMKPNYGKKPKQTTPTFI